MSRVAPIKSVCLPRLELCPAVITHLAKKVIDSLDVNFHNKYFWTDSSITLAWLE